MGYPVIRLMCFFFLLCCLKASSQPTYLLNKPYCSKYYFTDSLYSELYQIPQYEIKAGKIQSIIRWAEQNNDDELVVLLQLLKCKFKASQGNTVHIDDIDAELKGLLATYSKRSQYLNADILQNIGDFYYYYCNKNSLAFEYYLLAYNQYKNFNPQHFPGKRLYTYELGGSYFRYDDYYKAIKYLKEALVTKIMGRYDLTTTTYNTIGICYQKMKKYDSSLFYFNIAHNNALINKQEEWIGITEGNIGTTYFMQGKYAESIPLLEKNVCISFKTKQRKNAIASICFLANAYLRLNNIDKAEQTLQKVQTIRNEVYLRTDYALSEQLYKITAKIHAAKGNTQLAYLYADSVIIAKDSATQEQIASNQTRADEKVEYVQKKLEQERINLEKQRELLLRNSLIIIIILFSVIAILFISRQRIQKIKLAVEKEKAEADLAIAISKLISFRQSADEKDELIEQYSGQIEQLKKEDEEQKDSEVRAQLEGAILLTDEQWDEFRKLFEKVHKGFLNNLKKKIPDLTPSEIRFITLSKLKLSPKEMASMLGVSPNTIRIYKFRLRKKLNMDKEWMMDEWIENI